MPFANQEIDEESAASAPWQSRCLFHQPPSVLADAAGYE
jgi:hypothetical protein